MRKREATSARLAPVRRPEILPRVSTAGPTLPTTVPLTGFPNLTAAVASPDRPALFQTGNARGVRSSGVSSSRAAAPARRRTPCPRGVLPAEWPLFLPRKRNLREAPPPLPRMPGREPLVAFRASSHTRIGPHLQRTINTLATDLPLLSFHLLMVLLPPRTRAFRLGRRLRFTPPGPLPDPRIAALHGLLRGGAAPLSPVEPTISRFSAFGRPSCYG